MLGPLLFDNRGAIVKKKNLQKKIFNSKKKNSKKAFFAKKTFYWTWIWKMLWSKKDAQGSYYAQKKFQQEKIKIEGVAFISKKYLKSHGRDPKKRFFQFRILRSVSVCSLYLLQPEL